MRRQDFVFVIGYQGAIAFVDKKLRARFGSLDYQGLLKQKLYKPAFSWALYEDSQEKLNQFQAQLKEQGFSSYQDIESLKRLFGVFRVPKKIQKLKYI